MLASTRCLSLTISKNLNRFQPSSGSAELASRDPVLNTGVP